MTPRSNEGRSKQVSKKWPRWFTSGGWLVQDAGCGKMSDVKIWDRAENGGPPWWFQPQNVVLCFALTAWPPRC